MVCSVLMCENRNCSRRKIGVSFHKFPLRNPRLLKVWLRNISRPGDWQPSTQSRICSDHFHQESLVKVEDRVELKENSVPTLHFSFRAKGAPPIAEHVETDEEDEEAARSSSVDHSYSSGDKEPPRPSVEVAMKEHSYFTGVAPHCIVPQSGQPALPEAQEAPDDHTYHSNLPSKQPLDDHTYNREGEVVNVDEFLNVLAAKADDLTSHTHQTREDEGTGLRNFDHTYNNKKNDTPGPIDNDSLGSTTNSSSPKKGQKRSHSEPSWKDLFEENRQLKQRLILSEQRSAELRSKLLESSDQVKKLQLDVSRLKMRIRRKSSIKNVI